MIPEIIRDLTMKKGGAVKEAVKGASKGAKQAAKATKSVIEDWEWRPSEQVIEEVGLQEVPDYIQGGFGNFMAGQQKRAKAGEVGARDLIKAYTITRSSVNRSGLPRDTATKTGMKLPKTEGLVRPEGAFSEWLGSKQGQNYLKAAERGEVDEKAIADLQEKFAPFGMASVLADDMRWAVENTPRLAENLSETIVGDPQTYRSVSQQLQGIGPAKSGFMGSLIGRGDFPTLDARQLRLHTGAGGAEAAKYMRRQRGLGGEQAVGRLADRQQEMGLEIDPSLDPFYQHLTHHAVWDKVADEKTTHEDIVRAMMGYAKGGPVRHLKMGGLTVTKPQQSFQASDPSPDPIVQDILRQLGVNQTQDMTPEQLQQFNDMYNRALEERRIKEETYDYPFKEWDAVLSQSGYAKGGKVSAAVKGALEGAKKAAKAAKRHPIVFKPAAPLGKEEIRKMAQQMAEQTTGEFVRPDPTKSVNPAGKSKKQFERERDLRKVIRANAPEKEAPFVDIAKEEGNLIVAVPGDPTIGGVLRGGSLNEPPRGTHELVAIDDVEFDVPVQLYGGPRYGDEEKFWASNVSAASGIQNPVTEFSQAMGDRPVIGMYTKMTPESSRFALHTLDSLLAYQQPHRLPKKTRAELTKLVKAGNPKAGKFPGFAGFDDPETVLLQAKQDPELRKHISKVLAMPSVNQPLKMRPGLDVLSAISHPEIENLQTGASGFSLGVLRPGAGLTESIHPTYSHDIPGEFLGQTRYPIPAELAFPRTMSYVRENIPTGQPFNTMKMVGAREVIDPQYIDQIKMYEELMKKYTGRKKGGLASIKKVRKNG